MKRRRRALLTGLAAGSTAITAGCLSGGNDVDPATVGVGGGDGELTPPTIGNGPVGVAVFSDFSCLACRQFDSQIKPVLVSEYAEPGTIRIVHRDLVLGQFEWSRPVANAAWAVKEAAGEEAFWTYVEAMYQRQEEFSHETIETVAADTVALGEQARTAAEAGTYDSRIDADGDLYDRIAGQRQTPAVFVDGQRVDPGFENIETAIQSAQ